MTPVANKENSKNEGKKRRIDLILLENNFVQTRSQAQLLIREGKVSVMGRRVEKCGELIAEEAVPSIKVEQDFFPVGRGYFKLKGALTEFGLSVKGKVAADIGASTGGFTQLLLQEGASKVFAIDVGHDQLDPLLRKNERVCVMEGINVRYPFSLAKKVEFCVVDLSFISLRAVLMNLDGIVDEEGEMLVLFKPQFELGPGKSKKSKKGVVLDPHEIRMALEDFVHWWGENGESKMKITDFTSSPIEGKEGNREFFFYLKGLERAAEGELGRKEKLETVLRKINRVINV